MVGLPYGKKPMGCKWAFSIKYKVDGYLDLGIDYQETFAPIAKMNSIKILLPLVVNLDWTLHQFDMKNALFHGNLEEEIYLNVPPGFKNLFNERRVCKVKKSLYGLKQSPIAWFERSTKPLGDMVLHKAKETTHCFLNDLH